MLESSYRLIGVAPILMHNEALADPLNKWARSMKEISSKRKKTDADLLELSRREWRGGLYYDNNNGVHVPARCIEAMLRDAAKKTKMGKAVQQALIVPDDAKLEYKGPQDPDGLWEQQETFCLRATVGVQRARVVRSRPVFPQWSLTFTANYDEEVLNPTQIGEFLEVGGRLIGLCEWRPKFGRFTYEKA